MTAEEQAVKGEAQRDIDQRHDPHQPPQAEGLEQYNDGGRVMKASSVNGMLKMLIPRKARGGFLSAPESPAMSQ